MTKLFKEFFESEKAAGVILVFLTILSLVLANSGLREEYSSVWNFQFADHSVGHWINDGLMTIFFLLIGLELEREIYDGELSNIKQASLPLFGALGGMVVPAGIFLLFNYGTATQAGAGIPMATDIAFAIALLSLLGSRVPLSLKIFLTALAVIDDLGAIMVIAIFYTSGMVWANLIMAMGIFALLLVLNRLKVHNLIPYIVGGIAMWYFMLHSGVHATITGVLLAFAIPFGDGKEKTASYILQHFLHKPVAFFILPLFAMANTGMDISSDWYTSLASVNSIGIIAGLTVGKPLGIAVFCLVGVALGLCVKPAELKWKSIIGAGFLGGIGFTMSIFITLLAYSGAALIVDTKMAVMVASVLAGGSGLLLLHIALKPGKKTIE